MSLLDKASLCITPNAYKENILYSVIPNTTLGDMDVVRATTATRVNEQGLIEVVPRNLFTYSNDFTNSNWIKTGATFSGNTLTGSAGTALKGIYQGQTTNGTQSAYFDVEYVNHRWVQILIGTQGSDIGYVNYDIQNKVVGDQSGGYTGSIQDFGTFVRIKFNCNTLNKVSVLLILVDLGSAARGEATSSTGSLKLFRSQNELGASTEYFPTTDRLNIPRIDYTNGSCPSLLVEPQRTNLLTYSEEFNDASWTKINATITANNLISPDGTQNAELVTTTGVSRLQKDLISLTAGQRSLSCFVKAGNQSQIVVQTYDGIVDAVATFNLSTGTVVSTTAGVTAKIENYGNGWYRLTHSFNSAGIIYSCQFYPSTAGTYNVWGAQLEVGSYATSYIPTVASTVTRNADVISKTGISSLIGQTEGTILFDYFEKNGLGIIPLRVNGSDGKIIWIRGTGAMFFGNGSALLFNNFGTPIANQRYKIAFVYGQNDFRLYVNGSLVSAVTSGTFTGTFSDIQLPALPNEDPFGQQYFVNSLQLYKTKLTNAELATLTTI